MTASWRLLQHRFSEPVFPKGPVSGGVFRRQGAYGSQERDLGAQLANIRLFFRFKPAENDECFFLVAM